MSHVFYEVILIDDDAEVAAKLAEIDAKVEVKKGGDL